MALQQFLSAIRKVRNMFFGRMLQSSDTGRRVDTASLLDVATQTVGVWLAPDLVKDYDEADFDFLPPDKRAELSRAVSEFRQLTQTVQNRPPSADQIGRGYDLFVQINNIPAPYFEEPDIEQVAEATRSVRWPSYVQGAQFRFGSDSSGDPAVWIWLVLNDDVEIESSSVQADCAGEGGIPERDPTGWYRSVAVYPGADPFRSGRASGSDAHEPAPRVA